MFKRIHFPNLFISFFSFIPLFLMLFLMLFHRRSRPKTPSSPACEVHNAMAPPIMKGMLMCFKRPQFLMQLFLFTSILSTQFLFVMAICDIINDRGYNLQNYPSTVTTLFGCIFAIPISAYVDRTKRFASMSNLLLALTAITVIALRIVGFEYVFCILKISPSVLFNCLRLFCFKLNSRIF